MLRLQFTNLLLPSKDGKKESITMASGIERRENWALFSPTLTSN